MAPRPILNGMTILIVEDDYFQADDARSALERAGARVVGPYNDAVSAIAALRDRGPNCAVVDINLGAGPNLEVAVTARELGIPFVFMTGYDQEVLGPDFGHVERLQKPLAAPVLVQAVARLSPRGG